MKNLFLIAIFLTINLFAENIAIVKSATGDAKVLRQNQKIALSPSDKLIAKDVIMTGEDSSLGILFHDGTALSLGSKSLISVDSYIFKPAKSKFDLKLNMKKGTASFESGKIGKLAPKSVAFRVPDGVIGVRGTKFFVKVEE